MDFTPKSRNLGKYEMDTGGDQIFRNNQTGMFEIGFFESHLTIIYEIKKKKIFC
jgi:hypothetical protein